MGLLLGLSVLLRAGALFGFLVLFWKRRHPSLALLAIAMAWLGVGVTQRLIAAIVAADSWDVWVATPQMADWRGAVVSLAYLLGVALYIRLFTQNDALAARANEDARRLSLLLRELDHRVRNNLAGLLSLIDLSTPDEPSSLTAERLRRRIGAISECHSLLARSDGEPVAIQELVMTLARANPDVPAESYGADVELPQRLVQPLGMILQELFANARKHGGCRPVQIQWRTDEEESDRVFELLWLESGEIPCMEDGRSGTGLGLVRGLAEYELGGEMSTSCSRDGLRHWIRAPLGEAGWGLRGGEIDDRAAA